MKQETKPGSIRGVKTVLTAFLACLILAVPFVTNCLLIGEVTAVQKSANGGYVTVELANPALFRWIERLSLKSRPYSTVKVFVKNPGTYAESDPFLALIRGETETSFPPIVGAWIVF